MSSRIYDKYLELKKVDCNKMYLFKSGKFYIFIADDCDLINEYIVLKKVKFTNDIYKCGFPENVLDDYLRVFKNHNLNIEIIEDYSTNNSLEQSILNIDVNSITPLDALLKIIELQEQIKNGKRS